MNKGRHIYTDNLILRIIVTYFGTFGAASVIERITYPAVDMGFIGITALIFSLAYTLILSYYGKMAWLVRIIGMAVILVAYVVINLGAFISGIRTLVNVFMSMSAFTGGDALTVGSAGVSSVRCVCVVVVMIIAILAATEVNVFPNMLVSLAIVLPMLSIFIAAVIVPDIVSIVFSVLFIFDSMALGRKKQANQNVKMVVIVSAVIAVVVTFVIPQENYKRNSFFDDAREMVTDIVYDTFGIDLNGDKSEQQEEKNKVNASIGIGNGDVGLVDEVYYNDTYAGELKTMSDIGIAYAKIYTGRNFNRNNWQRWNDTREMQYSYTSAVHEFVLDMTKRKNISLDEDEQKLADRYIYYQQSFTATDSSVYDNGIQYRIIGGDVYDYADMGGIMRKYRSSATINSYESYVHDQYLFVNAEDSIVVNEMFGTRELQTAQEKADYIQSVVTYLKDNYTYTLKPGKVPDGKSVVEYFLKDSKKGYCTYFATSAAIILRCSGIPTRYCAGYTVNTRTAQAHTFGQDNEYMNYEVYDNAAHAWVEAYIDGYGWVTVDPTPGYGENDAVEEASTEQTSEGTSQSYSSESTDNNTEADNTSDTQQQEVTTQQAADINSRHFSGKIRISGLFVVICAAILIVIAAVACVATRIVSRIHLLRNNSVDEKQVLKMYAYLERLLASLGYRRNPDSDYEEYIDSIVQSDEHLRDAGLEDTVQTILAVRFGNVKCVDKADITGIINTIRQVRSYALKKARGLKKLIVCLI